MRRLLLLNAQALDLATTLAAVNIAGIGGESNPLARAVYLFAGSAGLILLKIAAVGIFLRLNRFATLTTAMTTAGLAAALLNAASIRLL